MNNDREAKIKQLQSIQEGKLKPLDLINHGFWLWHLKEGTYHCEVLKWEHLKLSHEQWLKFCTGGGTHLVEGKTYSTEGNNLNNLIKNDYPLPSWYYASFENDEQLLNDLKTFRGDKIILVYHEGKPYCISIEPDSKKPKWFCEQQTTKEEPESTQDSAINQPLPVYEMKVQIYQQEKRPENEPKIEPEIEEIPFEEIKKIPFEEMTWEQSLFTDKIEWMFGKR